MPKFDLDQDGGFYATYDNLTVAVDMAEELLGITPEGAETTFTVRNEYGDLVATVTNRRILGTFTKQVWIGRDEDQAAYVGEERFDCTDAVLLMPYQRLMELNDNDESSDELGRDHVSWDGPCSVEVVEAVCEYFGVSCMQDITRKALDFARSRANPQPAREEVVQLNLAITLRVAPGLSVGDLTQQLAWQFGSQVPGIVVTDVRAQN